ncbi:MAG: OmpA family protein [Deltaproteobacteria bacterium]|nr:OmpA family protein [Deltaproteobacteria bacterium]
MLEAAHDESAESPPIWPAFGDLMACLFGIFVLLFVWAIAFHVDLSRDLAVERDARVAEAAKREKLEELLKRTSGNGFEGRVTMIDGRIGIGGAVLFRSSSADLQPEGATLLGELAKPLASYLAAHETDAIMVSGFTDNLAVANPAKGFKDNWELSAARALTVVRALVAAGLPADRVFAAGFGETHPVAPNASDDGRAKNRRVEIAPVPRR